MASLKKGFSKKGESEDRYFPVKFAAADEVVAETALNAEQLSIEVVESEDQ